MIDSNTMVMAFFSQNWIAILVMLNLLKGIAILTPSVKDDKVVSMLSSTYDEIKDLSKLVFKRDK